MRFLHPFLVAVLLLGAFTPGKSFALAKRAPARSCVVNFKPGDPKAYRRALSRETDYERSILLPETRAKNQGLYGCCWIAAPLGRWERMLAARIGRKSSPPLSQDYLIFASLMYRIEEGIYTGAEVSQGGWAEVADWMAQNVGLMPEDAWTPKINFHGEEGAKVVEWLNERVQAIFKEIPEKKSSGLGEDAIWKHFENKKLELMREFKTKVGTPPGKFMFNGKKYSPHSFSEFIAPKSERWTFLQLFPSGPRHRSIFVPDPDGPVPEKFFEVFPNLRNRLPVNANKIRKGTHAVDLSLYELYSRATAEFVETRARSLAEIHVAVIESLRAGRAVHISIPMVKGFYNDTVGIMSLAAYGKTAKDIDHSKVSGGHGMLITGVLANHDGDLVGYRIQNSWGEAAGDLGYYTMDRDYFEAFVDAVTISRPKSSD